MRYDDDGLEGPFSRAMDESMRDDAAPHAAAHSKVLAAENQARADEQRAVSESRRARHAAERANAAARAARPLAVDGSGDEDLPFTPLGPDEMRPRALARARAYQGEQSNETLLEGLARAALDYAHEHPAVLAVVSLLAALFAQIDNTALALLDEARSRRALEDKLARENKALRAQLDQLGNATTACIALLEKEITALAGQVRALRADLTDKRVCANIACEHREELESRVAALESAGGAP